MAKEAIYEKNSLIEFKYRCNGDPATANPTVDILDETGVINHTLAVGVDPDLSINLLQVGTSRLYRGAFTPDTSGIWTVHGKDDNGGDQAKDYPVGDIGVQTMAEAVVTIDGKVDIIDDKIDGIVGDSGGAHFA